MAEDEPKFGASEEDETADQAPSIHVPSHSPLPPPPEVPYTRPPSARNASVGLPPTARNYDSGSSDDAYGAAGHGAGLAAGTTFVVSIVAGALAGNWVDQHWIHSSTPWGTLVMTLVGFAVGFLNLQRIMARANRERDKK